MEVKDARSVKERFQGWKWLQELSYSKIRHRIKNEKLLRSFFTSGRGEMPAKMVKKLQRKVRIQKIFEVELQSRKQTKSKATNN